ncbi:hypothetical protein F5B20DRAFT_510533 [Whalleya microplaca]|nr:hypothetical protein F5B20DRAFT_510533 [Whalleya microplaca]
MSRIEIMRPSPRVELAPPTDPWSVVANPRCPFLSLHISESALSKPHISKDDISGLACPTRQWSSCQQISFISRTERSSTGYPMNRPPPLESMRSVIGNALPNVTIESIHALPTDRLQRLFSVKVSDGRTLILSLPMPLTVRLLRSEQALTFSEALVIKWILSMVLETSIQPKNPLERGFDVNSRIGDTSTEWGQNIDLGGTNEPAGEPRDILRYLPLLITHSSSSTDLGTPFNFFEPTKGTPISKLIVPVTTSERKIIDFQVGQLLRKLSGFTSPNRTFGSAAAVIDSETISTESHRAQSSVGHCSVETWKQAFHSLLEGILRDAEDMAVTISYEPIRGHFTRLSHYLDAVVTPRLVILDASDDSNILVTRSTKSTESGEGKHTRSTSDPGTKRSSPPVPPENPISTRGHQSETQEPAAEQSTPNINVTGLRDWSNCMFGDPLIATVFSRTPTPEFLGGFRRPRNPHRGPGAEPGRAAGNDDLYDDIIEDRENAPARLLLYECYHATADVVRQFYRPSADSSEREIAARRRLAAVLARLEDVDEVTGKRPRRGSGGGGEETWPWPVKKARGDTPDPRESEGRR